MHSSFIIHERSTQYRWEGVGALSVKTFRGGRARYTTDSGHYVVDDSCYLILNQGQRYSITIESLQRVESFCVFLGPDLAGDAYRTGTTAPERLLDDPLGRTPTPLFVERTYARDEVLSPALARLQEQFPAKQDDRIWVMEQLHRLMARLLRVHRRVMAEAHTLAAARPATREELYRRAHLARDYLLAHLDRAVSLEELAAASALSINHLLRTFRQVFGQSPHQLLTTERIARARRLLAETDAPVTDVCLAIGFESLGSFSTLFRRKTGVSPQQYRKAIR